MKRYMFGTINGNPHIIDRTEEWFNVDYYDMDAFIMTAESDNIEDFIEYYIGKDRWHKTYTFEERPDEIAISVREIKELYGYYCSTIVAYMDEDGELRPDWYM